MRISIFTLLSIAISALVTSCVPPYPTNYDPNAQHLAEERIQNEQQVINDAGQQQLADARERLENGGSPNYANTGELPTVKPQIPSVTPKAPAGPKPYPYAAKVPGKPGFVFNPYTKNQVDVRGIPSGTLVRDPYDDDQTHKFRVP